MSGPQFASYTRRRVLNQGIVAIYNATNEVSGSFGRRAVLVSQNEIGWDLEPRVYLSRFESEAINQTVTFNLLLRLCLFCFHQLGVFSSALFCAAAFCFSQACFAQAFPLPESFFGALLDQCKWQDAHAMDQA